MVRLLGVSEHHYKVEKELLEMKEALDAEHAGGKPRWYEMFTGPRMAYRRFLALCCRHRSSLLGRIFSSITGRPSS